MNIMTYDFNGVWSQTTAHNAPLYGNAANELSASWNADYGILAYLNLGLPKSKTVMGLPMYGRSFSGVTNSNNGGLFQNFKDVGP